MTKTTLGLALAIVATTFGVLFACGSSSSSAAGAGAEAGVDAPAPGTTPCYPDDPSMPLACKISGEMCVDDYAGVAGLDPKQQCKTFPAACAGDRTCTCVTREFTCGITTTCSMSDAGAVRITCQPD
jgi:hypothetical protein